MEKKVILNIPSVYTANAFVVNGRAYVGAGSETTPAVYLYDIKSGESELVSDCPGGVMSFVPLPGNPDVFYSIMGLFPPFVGAEAGVFKHTKKNGAWETVKAMELPFAHRCDILRRDGKDYLFAASVSQFKENPADWSKAGEIYLIRFDENGEQKEPELVFKGIFRNHGMLKACVNGKETILISGAEGIYYFDEISETACTYKKLFDKEVSEFGLVDLDGDGTDELVTIEPFHGNTLNVYKCDGSEWKLIYQDELFFGHGLSCGIFGGEPVIIVGNRRGPLTMNMYKPVDFKNGKFSKETVEEEAGPTQTQVFSFEGKDYILSANQLKNEVALYTK